MSERASIGCELFDAHADELALGQVNEPLRGQLLAHAGECPHCHSLLDGLGAVADRLLLMAPEIEPPAGFESRALARLDNGTAGPVRRSPRVRWLAVAAVVGVMVAAGVFATAQRADEPSTATAVIVAGTGAEVGSVQLVAEPTPYVLIAIDSPRPGPGIRTCELQRPDGTWEAVGWWDAADIASGVWAVGIQPAQLDATAMRIISDGDVVATAAFG